MLPPPPYILLLPPYIPPYGLEYMLLVLLYIELLMPYPPPYDVVAATAEELVLVAVSHGLAG
jgi:hypothetical protein